jgi:hypothetical protein
MPAEAQGFAKQRHFEQRIQNEDADFLIYQRGENGGIRSAGVIRRQNNRSLWNGGFGTNTQIQNSARQKTDQGAPEPVPQIPKHKNSLKCDGKTAMGCCRLVSWFCPLGSESLPH